MLVFQVDRHYRLPRTSNKEYGKKKTVKAIRYCLSVMCRSSVMWYSCGALDQPFSFVLICATELTFALPIFPRSRKFKR